MILLFCVKAVFLQHSSNSFQRQFYQVSGSFTNVVSQTLTGVFILVPHHLPRQCYAKKEKQGKKKH